MHRTKTGLALACALSGMAVMHLTADGEKVAVWQGKESTAWNNPANWVGGVVPGRYLAKDENNNTVTNGEYGWTARFELKNARWLVEFMGQIVSVSNLVFTGENNTTKVGTGASHRLYLEDGGGIYVEESCAKTPLFVATIGIDCQKGAYNTYRIRNDSAAKLEISSGFAEFRMAPGVFGYPRMQFEGKGEAWLGGSFPGNNGFRPDLYVAMDEGGEFHVTNNVGNFKTLCVPAGLPKQRIVIEPNSALRPVMESQRQIDIMSDTEIAGEGSLTLKMADTAHGKGNLNIAENAVADISATLVQAYTGDKPIFDLWGSFGGGTIRITGENTIPQDVTIRNCGADVKTIGMAGEAGNLGLGGKIILENAATLRYSGSGETTDRDIESSYLTNVIEQAGSGPLILAGTITSTAWQGALVLSNDTEIAATCAGPIVAGEKHPVVYKRGTGEWILSGENTTQGMFYLEGGTLTVGTAKSLPRLTVQGEGTLKIADGVALSLLQRQFLHECGTLDVIPGTGAKFVITDAVKGPAPEWLTICGRPAKYKSNGELDIANRGTVISVR